MVFCFPKAMAEAEAVLEAARGVRVASKQPPQTQSLEGDLYWKISSIFSALEKQDHGACLTRVPYIYIL